MKTAHGCTQIWPVHGCTQIWKWPTGSGPFNIHKYIRPYAKDNRKSDQVILAHCQWVKMDLGPFFQPGKFWWWMVTFLRMYTNMASLMSTGGWHFDPQNHLITKWAPPATRASKLATFDKVFESLSKMRKKDQKCATPEDLFSWPVLTYIST